MVIYYLIFLFILIYLFTYEIYCIEPYFNNFYHTNIENFPSKDIYDNHINNINNDINKYHKLSKKSNDPNITSKYNNLKHYLNKEESLSKYYNICNSYDCDNCDKTINNYDYIYKNCKTLETELNKFNTDENKLYLDNILNK